MRPAFLVVVLLALTSSCRTKGTSPLPAPESEPDPHERALMAAADPMRHPRNPNGTLRHDWMAGGNWDWRCWYCNVVKRP
jgi:hypothetical protein